MSLAVRKEMGPQALCQGICVDLVTRLVELRVEGTIWLLKLSSLSQTGMVQ